MVASRPAPAPIIAPKPTASISTQLTSLFKKKENKKSMNGFDDYHKYMRVMNARKSTQPGTMTLGSSSPTTPKNSSSKTWWKKNGK